MVLNTRQSIEWPLTTKNHPDQHINSAKAERHMCSLPFHPSNGHGTQGSERRKQMLGEAQANIKWSQDEIPARSDARLCAHSASALGSRLAGENRASHPRLEGRPLLRSQVQPCLRVTGGPCQGRAACPEPRAGPQGILLASQSSHQMQGLVEFLI